MRMSRASAVDGSACGGAVRANALYGGACGIEVSCLMLRMNSSPFPTSKAVLLECLSQTMILLEQQNMP